MRHLFASFLLAAVASASIEWQTDLKKALEISNRLDKPLFIFVERNDPPCRWCKKMKKKTLSQKDISNLINREFLPVIVDKNSIKIQEIPKPKYVPTIYILHKGEIIKKIIGYWSAEDFMTDLKEIQNSLKERKTPHE